ncbi:Asp-tRNA(Asn)/Glu-tRNA(Gln) amidotransferase subunit GatA [Candidatus Odyssella thessalonicensis]|uniref:Asp-tRNA(Asn)/Glu-tRNA(Gln) amidotransferase subunit GatA n=1 Tax=Candidatus Odyssella thessalonicensis TaxID=84647 RepID=UPI000225B744|nr:Asp-tRNA(Asn)/Glu-tRNA(Gln) amidotransferase subunit GatA [Candidatus Odyssella thessalonicensis]
MTKTNLTELTLVEAKEGLARKEFTAVELTQAFIDEMEKNRHLNAYITETPDLALEQAKASDARLAAGQAGKLEGLPLAIKDLYCTTGVLTTASSKMLHNFTPPYESTVTQNLWNQGAVMLGKVAMDEFAMGSSNTTSYYGNVISPWKEKDRPEKQLCPGGSSGGSAAAVAARMALAATASDTGGSIRQPAAFTGLIGIKPTYGLCSRRGMIAYASSLDQAGPLTHTVHDAALMLEVMAGHDPLDSTSLPVEIPSYSSLLQSDLKGVKIGIPKEYLDGLNDEMMAEVNKGIEWAKSQGATIHHVSLPMTKYALPTYYVISPAEASSNLARYDGVRYGLRVEGSTLDNLYENTRRDGFGAEVRRRILIGTYVLSAGYYDAYYLKAQRVRTLIQQDFEQIFKEVDLLLTPTTPGSAFALDEKPTDPVQMYLQDVYTVTVNLANLPGIAIPSGLDKKGLPLSLQLIGPRLSEQRLLNAALALEECAGFSTLVKDLRKAA